MQSKFSDRRRLFKTLFWVSALSLLVVVLLSVPLDETIAALRRLTWQQVLFLVVLNGLVLALFNARWWTILRGYGRGLPFSSLFGYRLATFGVSYFTPGPHFGGEPLQVLLVEKEQQTPRSTAIAALTIDKALELLVNFSFLLAGVILIVQQQLLGGLAAAGAILLFIVLVLLPIGYLILVANGRYPLTRITAGIGANSAGLQNYIDRVLLTVQESEQAIGRFIRRAPLTLFAALAISIAAWLLMIAEFWLMVSFLGVSLSFSQLVIVLTAARVAILMFMPAGLGALEVSQALAFGTIGLNPALGISASLLIRGRDVVVGGIGLWWGSRKLSLNYLTEDIHGGTES
jgi:glycosyltransferase 2 family protein